MNKVESLTFNDVFTFSNLYSSFRSCKKNVYWKTSVKNFETKIVQNISVLLRDLHSGKYKCMPFRCFKIRDRGKVRDIKAQHIRDRIVQKCLCDFYLVPLLEKRLIYDNGACMKGKGQHFAMNRLKCHLQRFFRTYNTNKGFILTFDFSKYFDSIDHNVLLNLIRKVIKDDKLFEFFKYLVSCFGGSVGIGLGSQISQVCALYFLNELDHNIKEKQLMKYYARYMDDGYIIAESLEKLEICKKIIENISKKLKIRLNLKKTRFWKIEKGFMILKRHWLLKDNNYIKTKPCHITMKRLRKRYKAVKAKEERSPTPAEYGKVNPLKALEGSINGFIKFFKNRRLENYVYN